MKLTAGTFTLGKTATAYTYTLSAGGVIQLRDNFAVRNGEILTISGATSFTGIGGKVLWIEPGATLVGGNIGSLAIPTAGQPTAYYYYHSNTDSWTTVQTTAE